MRKLGPADFSVTNDSGCERIVVASTAQRAAEKWAEVTFHWRDFNPLATCEVTDYEGVKTRWGIETESIPVFHAGPIAPAPPIPTPIGIDGEST